MTSVSTGAFPRDQVVELAQALIALDTAGANESAALALVVPLLEAVGLEAQLHALSRDRGNLVTQSGPHPAITLAGHLDTVPAGMHGWQRPPLSAEVAGGTLFGRGASDMKGAVAAMVLAVVAHRRAGRHCCSRGFRLVLTAAEEEGCLGAAGLSQALGDMGDGLLVIGEPTANLPCLGHKGALWARITAAGRSAHGSTPDLGDNAIVKLADWYSELRERLPGRIGSPVGEPTVSMGALHGGQVPNVVPDTATMLVDMRTVPGFGAAEAGQILSEGSAGGIGWELLLDLPSVWTDPSDPLVARALARTSRDARPASLAPPATYFTDASILKAPLAPAILLGPGEPSQAHAANEACSVRRLAQAYEIYQSLLDEFCDG